MKHGQLFAGIGGFGLAAYWAGIENVWANEIDPYCCKLLKKNFPKTTVYEEDIRNIGKHNLAAVDIISGGFPCQPFSSAGKRRGKDDDRYLWPEMLRIIRELQPTYIIGENVAGLLSMENGKTLRGILSDLENEGYNNEVFVIPAAGLGAWHKRDRLWVCSHANNSTGGTQNRGSNIEEAGRPKEKGEEGQPRESGRTSGQVSTPNATDTRCHNERGSEESKWSPSNPGRCSSGEYTRSTEKRMGICTYTLSRGFEGRTRKESDGTPNKKGFNYVSGSCEDAKPIFNYPYDFGCTRSQPEQDKANRQWGKGSSDATPRTSTNAFTHSYDYGYSGKSGLDQTKENSSGYGVKGSRRSVSEGGDTDEKMGECGGINAPNTPSDRPPQQTHEQILESQRKDKLEFSEPRNTRNVAGKDGGRGQEGVNANTNDQSGHRLVTGGSTSDGGKGREETKVRAQETTRVGDQDSDGDSEGLPRQSEGISGTSQNSDPYPPSKEAIYEYWDSEPDVGRVANGIPRRVDRLKGLGNAIVPQVALQLFEAILEVEREKNQ